MLRIINALAADAAALRALHVMGHGSARIARAVGAHPDTIRALVRGDATSISPRLCEAIIAVYDAWWDGL